MFNVGVAFIGFGLLLYAIHAWYSRSNQTRRRIKATVMGYKQFPTDTMITTNDFSRGANFRWHRIFEFTNPENGQTVQLYSNPGVANPEPIGTQVEISYEPTGLNDQKSFAWVPKDMEYSRQVGKISFSIGLIMFIALQFVPNTSFLHFVGALAGIGVLFIAIYRTINRTP